MIDIIVSWICASNTPHYTKPYHTTQHTPHHTTLHHTIPRHTTPHHTTPHYTTQYTPHYTTHTTLHHTTLHYTTLHHNTLHHTTPHHTSTHTNTHTHHTGAYKSSMNAVLAKEEYNTVWEEVKAFAVRMGRRPRILVAKMGQDGTYVHIHLYVCTCVPAYTVLHDMLCYVTFY